MNAIASPLNVGPAPSPDNFRPCFVVGNERSGTTLLTVLLGRHSELATTPETYFLRMLPAKKSARALTHAELLDQLFAWPHTKDMKLDRTRLAERFARTTPDYPALFRAMLEEFAAEHAPGKVRVGEKTPLHLMAVPTLIEWFPQGRIVCIVRDGRDVVLSLLSMPWVRERRLRPLCMNWMRKLKLAEDYRARYPEQFLMIRYEDLLDQPEQTVERVDGFFELPFEAQQFDIRVRPSHVVPACEEGWKGQALQEVDPSRKATWKKKATPEQLLVMNGLMGPALRRMGYEETELPRCCLGGRLGATLGNLAFRLGLCGLWHKAIERNLPAARAERRRRREAAASGGAASTQ